MTRRTLSEGPEREIKLGFRQPSALGVLPSTPVLQLRDVGLTYPGIDKPTLTGKSDGSQGTDRLCKAA